jgi:hypothetical protein
MEAEYCLLGRDAVKYGRSLQAFRGNLLPRTSGQESKFLQNFGNEFLDIILVFGKKSGYSFLLASHWNLGYGPKIIIKSNIFLINIIYCVKYKIILKQKDCDAYCHV